MYKKIPTSEFVYPKKSLLFSPYPKKPLSVFASINGKADVVTFRSTASTILQNFYDASRDADPEADKIRVIKAAADLIKTDIKSKDISKSFYPLPGEISSLASFIDPKKSLLAKMSDPKNSFGPPRH